MNNEPMTSLDKYLLAYLIKARKEDKTQGVIEVFNCLWDQEYPKEFLSDLVNPQLKTLRYIWEFIQKYWKDDLDKYPNSPVILSKKKQANPALQHYALSLQQRSGQCLEINRLGDSEIRFYIEQLKKRI